MELPIELLSAIENISANKEYKQLLKESSKISDKYRNNFGKGKRLITLDKEALVYSIMRMPATYGAVLSSIKYAMEYLPVKPMSLIDAGAGTGAATWAATSLYKFQNVMCLEREDAMINLGKSLMPDSLRTLENVTWKKHDLTIESIPEKADMVIASYALNEMKEDDRKKVLGNLWEATNMILIIVEPGTPAGYQQIIKNRDILLKLGAHIAAPCPHENNCALKDDDWCHFKCRIPRSKLHRQIKEGTVPYEDEKFSYIAVTREETANRNSRVLRHPYVGKGYVKLELCNPDDISQITVTKKNKGLYKSARKAKCGDSIKSS